jgi:hypothetical protein
MRAVQGADPGPRAGSAWGGGCYLVSLGGKLDSVAD